MGSRRSKWGKQVLLWLGIAISAVMHAGFLAASCRLARRMSPRFRCAHIRQGFTGAPDA
ncbi:hypothetical protein HED50_08695 [Ochrobactrum oryzae]|nr:hypothetical protein [Brucella oryzae]